SAESDLVCAACGASAPRGEATVDLEIILSSEPIPVGACVIDVLCSDQFTPTACEVLGGTWLGFGAHCPTNTCSSVLSDASATMIVQTSADGTLALGPCGPIGACVFAPPLSGGECQIRTASDCSNIGGTYLGDGSTCDDCNDNSVADAYELMLNTLADCNNNGVPDTCETMANSPIQDILFVAASDACPTAPGIGPGDYFSTTDSATPYGAPLQCGPWYGYNDKFYSYTPASDGDAYAFVAGDPQNLPAPDQFILGVYEGCPLTGTQVACQSTNSSGASFHVDGGTEYFIRVAKANSAFGSFILHLDGPRCVPNPSDVNGNGMPDECDCIGDITGINGVADGLVDIQDFIAVLLAINAPCNGCKEDVDANGIVDPADAMLVYANFGICEFTILTATAPTPPISSAKPSHLGDLTNGTPVDSVR
ncbi:MAG: hypothetical protein KC983_07750, partial [Phycisphaerales bacterium]|nr:hypothetical protein [Phycisphaerales bacterium]